MAFDPNDPSDKKLLEDSIAAAVDGLKLKNSELIGDNKKVKLALTALQEQFEGIDPAAVKALLSRAANDEETKLIAAGQIDQVVEKRVAAMREDMEKKLKVATDQVAKSDAFAARFRQRVLADAIRDAALKGGIEPTAADDAILRGSLVFQVDEEGNPVALKDGAPIIGKDGKTPLTPAEWVEGLREKAPHLWPKAAGGGANGSGASGAKKLSEMSEAERNAIYRESPEKYRQLKAADPAFKDS
jgi:hypothetical protein